MINQLIGNEQAQVRLSLNLRQMGAIIKFEDKKITR